jgi:hypothetical protein
LQGSVDNSVHCITKKCLLWISTEEISWGLNSWMFYLTDRVDLS